MTTTTEQNVDTNTEQQKATELSQKATKTTVSTEPDETKATPQELKQREIAKSYQEKVDQGLIDHKDLSPWLQERVVPKANVEVSEKDKIREELSNQIREDIEYEQALKSVPADTPKEKLEQMEEIMGDSKYAAIPKPERLEIAKYKVGIASNSELEKAREEGLKIGRFGLLGLSNHDPKESKETELSKIEKKYDNLPKFLQK